MSELKRYILNLDLQIEPLDADDDWQKTKVRFQQEVLNEESELAFVEADDYDVMEAKLEQRIDELEAENVELTGLLANPNVVDENGEPHIHISKEALGHALEILALLDNLEPARIEVTYEMVERANDWLEGTTDGAVLIDKKDLEHIINGEVA